MYSSVNSIERDVTLLETETNDIEDSYPLREKKNTVTLLQKRWKNRQKTSKFPRCRQLSIR